MCADPELRHTSNGDAVTSFCLAVGRDYKNQDGVKETDFIDIVAWRNTAEFVSKCFSKGSMAVASGRLQIRSWTDKDGNKRRTAEVVADNVYFGDSKRDSSSDNGYSQSYGNRGGSGYSSGSSYSAPAAAAPVSDFAMLEGDDSELPF